MADRIRIGVVGTGFVSRHFSFIASRSADYEVSSVLTRRDPADCDDHPASGAVTRDLDSFLDACDVVMECSGDPIHATDVISEAFERSRPVVTMNSEFHVTAGSAFVGEGLLTEAEGDQPGSEAALAEEVLRLGFRPLVYGNMKGFLNLDPTREDMEYWAKRQGISLSMVTSFTDGTKVQVEQALVANGLGATIAEPGLIGLVEDDLNRAAEVLGERARHLGKPISEYVLSPTLPHGVFVVGEHDDDQKAALEYLKMGTGPFYTVIRNSIFVHLEIMKTVRRLVEDRSITLDNSARPEVSVAAVAKRDVAAGTRVERAIGSFDFRGEAVRIAANAGHAPIGLLQDVEVVRPLGRGQIVMMDDVVVPESRAVRAWTGIEDRVLGRGDAG